MHIMGKLALAGVGIMALASAAQAQSASDEGLNSSDIIVQARRRDESVQDVPLVVQAVTAQDLSKLNIREFKDIQSLVPGLTMTASANGIGTQSTLRGVAFDVNASGNNGTIEFYMNDAPISSGVLFQSMFDVAQIEVLRGPQGTLRGRASPSGSITVTSRKPDLFDVGAYMTATANDIGGWNVNGAINVPILAEKLAVRVAGIVEANRDNRVTSLNSTIRPRGRTEGIRASVQFDPFDILSLGFNYTRTDRNVTTFDQVESLPGAPVVIRAKDRKARMATPRTFSQNFEVYNWSAELRVADQKLNYVGSQVNQKLDSLAPNDVGGFFGPAFPASVTGAGLTTASRGRQRTHEVRLSNDARLAGIFDYVVGYMNNDQSNPTGLLSDTIIFTGTPSASPLNLFAAIKTPIQRDSTFVENSYFANLTAHISDRTELSGGLRKIEARATSSLVIGGVLVPASVEDRKFEATIYSLSAKHRFSNQLMAYVNYGTSWRPGSSTNAVIQRDNTAPTAAQGALLLPPPERSKSIEAGIKADLLDNRLRFNFSAYHQTFKNFQFFAQNIFLSGVAAGNVPTVFTNITGIAVGVPAKVDGAEAEIQFKASDAFTIGAVLAYSKSKIKNGRVPCNDFFPVDGQPDTSTAVPTLADFNADGIAFCNTSARAGIGAPFTASIQAEFNQPVSTGMEGYLRSLVTYNGKSLNDAVNQVDDIKAHAIVNLFAGLRDPDGAWEIGAYAKNLLDTFRVTSRNNSAASTGFRTFAGAQQGNTLYREITVTAPREFGVTARFALGSR